MIVCKRKLKPSYRPVSAKSLFNCPPSPLLIPPLSLYPSSTSRPTQRHTLADKRYIINHSVCDLSYSMPQSLFLNVHQGIKREKEGSMFIHLFRPLTHSPSYPSRPLPPSHPNVRKFASPTQAGIKARHPLSKDLSLDVKKK